MWIAQRSTSRLAGRARVTREDCAKAPRRLKASAASRRTRPARRPCVVLLPDRRVDIMGSELTVPGAQPRYIMWVRTRFAHLRLTVKLRRQLTTLNARSIPTTPKTVQVRHIPLTLKLIGDSQ